MEMNPEKRKILMTIPKGTLSRNTKPEEDIKPVFPCPEIQPAGMENRNHQRGSTQKLLLAAMVILITTGAAVCFSMENWREMAGARSIMRQHLLGDMALWLAGGFMVLHAAVLIWRIVLFKLYRPLPDATNDQLPRCTVVVPAYNEGALVLKTLESLAGNDYPPEKLQIIAVDDGSQDDTWQWIKTARNRLGNRIMAIRLPRNKGKRHALHAGFLKARGDVFVTVDSDSIVEPQTLRRLVSPFIASPRTGAVAGNVRVLNHRKGLIPRMLNVVFVYSFDFIRATQSAVNTVMCTPGALSAYRRDIVMRVLPQWLNQTFCGRPATIGEDRAMTNLILREGYHVLFQENAKVYTDVPVHYTKLCKMLLRWARSNVRETIAMSRFAFRPFRRDSMIGARINLLLGWITLTASQLLLVTTWGSILLYPGAFGLNVLCGVAMSATLSAGLYAWRYRSLDCMWAYVYSIFWFTGLFWITPYALFTAHRSAWMTRQLPAVQRWEMGMGTMVKSG
jgi:hyaluronan synthase